MTIPALIVALLLSTGIRRYYVTIDFPSIGGGNCTDVVASTPGSTQVNALALGVPAGIATGGLRSVFNVYGTSPNQATIRHCCINGSCNPPSGVYTIWVFDYQ